MELKKKYFVFLVVFIFLSSCDLYEVDRKPHANPKYYVSYATFPEGEEDKLNLLFFTDHTLYVEANAWEYFVSAHFVWCCSPVVAITSIPGFLLDMILSPFKIGYGKLTFLFVDEEIENNQ